MNDFDGDYVERVFERDAGPVVNGVTVAEAEDAELMVGGDADEVRIAERVAAPDAEFGVALCACGGGEGESAEEEGGEDEEVQQATRATARVCLRDGLG